MIKKWLKDRNIKKQMEAGVYPSFIAEYWNLKTDIPPLDKKINELRFVVLDTETSGLDLKTDSIISIAAVDVFNNSIRIHSSFEMMVARQSTGNQQSISIHEIMKSDLKNAHSVKEVCHDFLDYLKADIIVAHHVGFDVGMINKMLNTIAPQFNLYNRVVDTAQLVKKIETPALASPYYSSHLSYDLDSILDRYEIDAFDRHTAWGDAYTTAILFMKCVKKLELQGYRTLKDLLV